MHFGPSEAFENINVELWQSRVAIWSAVVVSPDSAAAAGNPPSRNNKRAHIKSVVKTLVMMRRKERD
jgi:hypothetical protein